MSLTVSKLYTVIFHQSLKRKKTYKERHHAGSFNLVLLFQLGGTRKATSLLLETLLLLIGVTREKITTSSLLTDSRAQSIQKQNTGRHNTSTALSDI